MAKKKATAEARYRVRKGFRHDGHLVTNDNVAALPAAVLEERTKSGYLEEIRPSGAAAHTETEG